MLTPPKAAIRVSLLIRTGNPYPSGGPDPRAVSPRSDLINGAVVDRARQHGTGAPLNAAIVKLVHQFERGERKPSPDHYEEVLAAA